MADTTHTVDDIGNLNLSYLLLAQRMVKQLSKRFEVDGTAVCLSGSVGCAVTTSAATDPEQAVGDERGRADAPPDTAPPVTLIPHPNTPAPTPGTTPGGIILPPGVDLDRTGMDAGPATPDLRPCAIGGVGQIGMGQC